MDEYEEKDVEEVLCRVCHRPVWPEDDEDECDDIHPDCELKEDIQHIQRQTQFDGTGQDEECMMEML